MESVEQNLEEINGFIDDLFGQSNESLILVTPEKDIILGCNDSALTMFDVEDKKDFVNAEIYSLNKNKDKKDSLSKILDKLDSVYREIELITRKGREFWGEMYIKKIHLNDKNYYLIQISDISEKRKIEDELRKNDFFIRRITEANPSNIYVFDILNRTLIYSNNKLSKQLGYSYSQVKYMGKNYPHCLMPPEDAESYLKTLDSYRFIEDDEVYESEYRMKDSEGRWHWISFRSSIFFRTDEGEVKEIIGIAQDITLKKQFEYDNLRLAAFPRANPNPTLECDFDGNITYINPATYKLMKDMSIDINSLLPVNHIEICRKCSIKPDSEYEYEYKLKDKIMKWSYNPVSDIGFIHIYVNDVTDQRISEDKLIYDALHDPLTDLPNRSLFLDRLNTAFLHLNRKSNYLFAILFLDLDRFKIVNDSLGHFAGDKLLVQLSKRLNEIIRPTDTLARLGGDEFTILLDEIKAIGDVISVAERIKKALTYPFNIEDHEIFTTVSIGIALSTTEGNNNSREMMRNADMAMYKAKSKGKNRFEIYESSMHNQAITSLKIETELWKALENNEFYLEYQPIICFEDNSISGFEALIRWHHPTKGKILPLDFIKIAEEAGLITHIDMWVIENVCKQINEWKKSNVLNDTFSISINLSGKSFLNYNFVENIKQITEKYNIDPKHFKFEITERVMLENDENIRHILTNLRKMNIHLQIDDFGTGYSSLSYLHRLPISALKIDSSFIQNIDLEPQSLEIVKTIIMLAINLGIYVIAEGIETKQQLDILDRLNCHLGQGYLFYNPLSPDKVAELMLN